jgi:methylmalonyl-CoA mutase C-terminal domain/subunit
VLELLQERGAGHIHVIGGGIIPAEDSEALLAAGVKRLFGPGSSLQEIISYIGSLKSGGEADNRPARC